MFCKCFLILFSRSAAALLHTLFSPGLPRRSRFLSSQRRTAKDGISSTKDNAAGYTKKHVSEIKNRLVVIPNRNYSINHFCLFTFAF